MNFHRRLLGLATAFFFAFTGGCGSSGGAKLSGKVTIDGAPIASGDIQFLPLDGKGLPVSAAIKDGRYQADDLPIGQVNAILSARRETGETYEEYGQTFKVTVSLIPQHYAAGISLEVKAGNGEHDFNLLSQPLPQ